MEENTDSGLELVLDNRKLIVAFVLLMALCAAFFLFGFVEGKKQALHSEALSTGATSPLDAPSEEGSPSVTAVGEEETVEGETLDWYKNAQSKSGEAALPAEEKAEAPEQAADPPEPRVAEPVKRPQGAPAVAAPASSPGGETYSVQLGAFKDRNSARDTVAALRSRGYNFRFDPPSGGGTLYRLKVGRFKTRGEAKSMQLKLKNDGFSSFIATNLPSAQP